MIAPAGEQEAVTDRLATLAGASLREGATRRRWAKDNKQRRSALRSAQDTARQMRNKIRLMEARGQIVPGNVRKMADLMEATVSKLQVEIADQPAGIPGHTPIDAVPEKLRRGQTRSSQHLLARIEAHQRALDNHNA
ncbi:hypothetical protein [Nesterenkonia sp. CF4.4]|uniref:hypothetical protein n=1 Tax=Nesterenkonia sp. CF4.4 TaxID=3373079 RepID=UPI003EE485EA